MRKAAIFEEQLLNLEREVYAHFSELVKHNGTITVESEDVLRVWWNTDVCEAYLKEVIADGILVYLVKENRTVMILFHHLETIEDKLLLIDLIEDSLEAKGSENLERVKEPVQ